MENEIEVFRITPEEGKYYETATYTRKTGRWPNEKYYTTNQLKYVGKWILHESFGFGDGAQHRDYFINDLGEEVVVEYTYEGTTCFRDIKKPFFRELCDKFENSTKNAIKSLEYLSKCALSTSDEKLLRIQYPEIIEPNKL